MTQSLLQLHCKSFDKNKLRNHEGVLHYDGCELEGVLDFLNSVLCENAWGCGCGRPDEATSFFFAQFADLAFGKDYHRLPGGLELFKYACWKEGLINKDLSYTEKGEELLSVPELFFSVKWEQYDKDKQVSFVRESLPTLSFDPAAVPAVVKTVFGDVQDGPEIDYVSALAYVGILGGYLKVKHGIPFSLTDRTGWDKLYAVSDPVFENYEGEWYNSFHALSEVLEMEEHGGSTPGWLSHDEGIEKQEAIEKLFNCNDLFTYCLTS